MSKIIGENVTFSIEVEPSSILIVFDKKCDHAIVPWQDAFNLSEVMTQVITDIGNDFPRTNDRTIILREQGQIRFNHYKGLVAFLVDWTDRIKFSSIEAFNIVRLAIRKTAQDSNLELRGVRFKYDKQGMIKKLMTNSYTQEVR